MQRNILTIQIACATQVVFDFTLNPENTPLWIENIAWEKRNTEHPQIGSLYTNANLEGVTTVYELVEFVPYKTFTLKQVGGMYCVKYDFVEVGQGSTDLAYTEWVTAGELEAPFTQEPLLQLKHILELV